MVKVAEQLGKHPSYLYRLSRRFDWEERTLACELAQQQQQEADLRRLREDVARRQLEEVQRLRGLPLAGLSKWMRRDPATGEWVLDEKVKPGHMIDLLRLLWETESKATQAHEPRKGAGSSETPEPNLRSVSTGELQELLEVAKERALLQETPRDDSNEQAEKRQPKSGRGANASAAHGRGGDGIDADGGTGAD